MTTQELEIEKSKIDQQKRKLQIKEKILKEKEKRMRVQKCTEIGKVAFKAEIDQLDPLILLGAFLEVAEKKNNDTQINEWKKKSEAFLDEKDSDSLRQLIVSFSSDVSTEIRGVMRKMDFKWNKFRKEFYGYGCQKNLEKTLEGSDFKIEILD